MIKLKDIAELPVAESAESVSFVVHEDGVAKQVPYDEVFKSSINWIEFDTPEGAKFAVVSSSLFKNKDFEEMKKVPGHYTSYGALYDLLCYCDLVIRRNRGYSSMVNLSSYAPRIVNSLKALYDAGYINDAAKSGFIFLQKDDELDNPNLWGHFRITYQKSKAKLEVRNDLDISFGFELNSETGAIVSDFTGITDKELARSDKPADAKATGDAIRALEERTAQPDWNQNDPDSPDHVKNRTHWEEINKIFILPETSISISSDMEEVEVGEPLSYPIAGEVYKILLNGMEYEYTAVYGDSDGDCVDIGNGEPFYISIFRDDIVWLRGLAAGDYKISIYTDKSVIHKLDSKFIELPEDIMKVDMEFELVGEPVISEISNYTVVLKNNTYYAVRDMIYNGKMPNIILRGFYKRSSTLTSPLGILCVRGMIVNTFDLSTGAIRIVFPIFDYNTGSLYFTEMVVDRGGLGSTKDLYKVSMTPLG